MSFFSSGSALTNLHFFKGICITLSVKSGIRTTQQVLLFSSGYEWMRCAPLSGILFHLRFTLSASLMLLLYDASVRTLASIFPRFRLALCHRHKELSEGSGPAFPNLSLHTLGQESKLYAERKGIFHSLCVTVIRFRV